jgi:hypothetical protein
MGGGGGGKVEKWSQNPILPTGTANMKIVRGRQRNAETRNRTLRIVSGPQREEITGNQKNLRAQKLHNLYLSSNIISMIKSMRMRWAEHWQEWDESIVYRNVGMKTSKEETTKKN